MYSYTGLILDIDFGTWADLKSNLSLLPSSRRDRSWLLQCIRFAVRNKFFLPLLQQQSQPDAAGAATTPASGPSDPSTSVVEDPPLKGDELIGQLTAEQLKGLLVFPDGIPEAPASLADVLPALPPEDEDEDEIIVEGDAALHEEDMPGAEAAQCDGELEGDDCLVEGGERGASLFGGAAAGGGGLVPDYEDAEDDEGEDGDGSLEA